MECQWTLCATITSVYLIYVRTDLSRCQPSLLSSGITKHMPIHIQKSDDYIFRIKYANASNVYEVIHFRLFDETTYNRMDL
jgi:hypothetical protein